MSTFCPKSINTLYFHCNKSNSDLQGNLAAHELGHNFNLTDQCTPCSIMYSCSQGTLYCTSDNFTANDINRIKNYAIGAHLTCTPSVSQQDCNACLLDIPPVSLGFGLSMTKNLNANDFITLSDASVICPGVSFNASFNNTYDPSGSVLWTLGPLLAFDDGEPENATGLQKRKFIFPDSNSICSPFESWVAVSFTYSCGTLTYKVRVRLGSSFGLDGTYTGTGGPSYTIASANSVSPGSYDLKLENPNVPYVWTQTIGTTTTILPYSTSNISFGITSNQSISFTASTTSECCLFQRTFAFFTSGHWLPVIGSGGSGTSVVYPNPATDMLTVIFDNVESSAGTGRTIEVVDLMGKIVRRLSKITDNHYEFSVSNLAPGAYWIRINDGQQVQTVNVQKL